ncbi:flagellar basal body P-ring formation chaperone FlgA [Acidovorax sp. BLS4]|uniref:flagellar basal body P-ring formation chaperone FlgA n=1 Tax=Acidovorax sp. BLS4 TaxID=3273430 RepID=UPI00355BC09C
MSHTTAPRFLPTLRLARMAALAAAFALPAATLRAQAVAEPAADLGGITQRWLDDALQRGQSGTASMPLRMEVSVGALDPRLRLAPCARVEPYLPAGSRLWGRTRLGLRCVDGATAWNVFLPVTVKAYGPAWVLTGNVASGAVLTAADATEAEVDWAAETTAIVANPDSWVGMVASRQLMAGQAVRQHMVKAPTLFKAGAAVRVVAQGRGYSVTSAGQAITAGAVGETVRIRMENGRVVAGVVSENGTVEITL